MKKNPMRDKGRAGTRAKNGIDGYYKGRYHLAFYRDIDNGRDERYYKGFNNVIEICKYKGLEVNTTNINKIHQALYKALDNNGDHYTTLIDGIPLRVYLIDMIDEIRENERRENEMKKFVKINSTLSLEVYPDMASLDTTNLAAHMSDRLSAKPNWVYPILIRKGIHFYPTEIKNWHAVKKLATKNILSISEEVDEVPDDEKEACAKMRKEIEKIARRAASQPKKPEETK